MSLLEISRAEAEPVPPLRQRAEEDRFPKLDDETWLRLRLLLDHEAKAERRKPANKPSVQTEATEPPAAGDSPAEIMAAGVLDNIRKQPLGELCTAYFMVGDDVHRDAQEIVRRELGLAEPSAYDEGYTALGALGRGLLVYRDVQIAEGTEDPFGVWYQVVATSENPAAV